MSEWLYLPLSALRTSIELLDSLFGSCLLPKGFLGLVFTTSSCSYTSSKILVRCYILFQLVVPMEAASQGEVGTVLNVCYL